MQGFEGGAGRAADEPARRGDAVFAGGWAGEVGGEGGEDWWGAVGCVQVGRDKGGVGGGQVGRWEGGCGWGCSRLGGEWRGSWRCSSLAGE